MKKAMFIVIVSLFLSSTASARNTISAYLVAEAMAHEKAESVLGTSFLFYFGDQKYGEVLKKFGEIRTNRKTNAFNKTDTEACQWVFLSAMKALKDRAIQMGGNAVVNIRSNYKDNVTRSNDSFQCGAGAVVAGVALIGDVVKIEEQSGKQENLISAGLHQASAPRSGVNRNHYRLAARRGMLRTRIALDT